MKKSLSANAFARLLHKDPHTIITWIKKGYIPNVKKIGSRYQIPFSELEKAKSSDHYPPQK